MGKAGGWALEEFADVDLGDKRLDERLVTRCDRLSEVPQSPITQAGADWAETKAAYRFFRNSSVDAQKVLAAHSKKTAVRARPYQTILALQDTSYLVYTSHHNTTGLGKLSLKQGKHVDKIYSHGLVMHSCLAVTTDGLPLGLLNQKIFGRELHSVESRKRTEMTPIEEKESYRWLESLEHTQRLRGETRVVTVCDREAARYELFRASDAIQSPVLVRANVNSAINKKSRYAEKDVRKLWDYMRSRSCAGTFHVDMPAKSTTKHCRGREGRVATLELKFGSFVLNPPRNNVKHRRSTLPDLEMYAIYVYEQNPPDGVEPLEWRLLTNLPVPTYEHAYEKVRWYCLRWRIEMFFNVLKSGFRVEQCRLASAERLIRYLTIMSILAWRLFMITLLARTNENQPCSQLLTETEWNVLYLKVHKKKTLPPMTPTIGEVVRWIARLGGFLARKGDGNPGTLTLWRGWKRLTDLTEGWELARQC